ncbi:hypothetical protein SAMN05444920_14042 [Nonomuraea solani]|uniref:Uncharacterized protein n=1 Tax=Nonomuraea solani TaxID=1144553 RepID=A0A1H6F0E6_9ACTN|nr:hypothetical protein [Nonomuraea solani]SEH03628.1 hypothetical protein SAMN05444920_14042 [Nonomuraea solani]
MEKTIQPMLETFAIPTGLMAGACAVGDPIRVLPMLFHLLWHQVLTVDLRFPLSESSVVSPGREYGDVDRS